MKKTFWEQIQEKQEKYIQENLNEIAEEIKRKIFDDIEKEGDKMEMSKYKNGDKFIIEIEDLNETFGYFYRIKGSDCNLPERCLDGLKKFDKTKIYEQGLADAWEAAREIAKLPFPKATEIFGMHGSPAIVEEYSAIEAISKIKAYEEKQQNINVGDEIIDSNGEEYVITNIHKKWFYGMTQDGKMLFTSRDNKKIKKTGRHFPQVAEMLKSMREE